MRLHIATINTHTHARTHARTHAHTHTHTACLGMPSSAFISIIYISSIIPCRTSFLVVIKDKNFSITFHTERVISKCINLSWVWLDTTLPHIIGRIFCKSRDTDLITETKTALKRKVLFCSFSFLQLKRMITSYYWHSVHWRWSCFKRWR